MEYQKQLKMPETNKLDEILSRKEFNQNFLVRHYPDANDRNTHSLIGYDKLLAVLNRRETQINILKKIADQRVNRRAFKGRSGYELVVYAR